MVGKYGARVILEYCNSNTIFICTILHRDVAFTDCLHWIIFIKYQSNCYRLGSEQICNQVFFRFIFIIICITLIFKHWIFVIIFFLFLFLSIFLFLFIFLIRRTIFNLFFFFFLYNCIFIYL